MFPLARPHQLNDFHGVNIYLDEAGQLKGLPFNSRASGLAELCGFKAVQFAGDVFIGRLKVGDKLMKNENFYLNEISSDAQWLKDVKAINYEFGVATNQVSMDPSLQDDRVNSGKDEDERYNWIEDQSHIDISIIKPSDIVSSKDLIVKFLRKSLKIESKKSDWKIELNLFDNVSPDDCTWTLSSEHIEVSLEKSKQVYWAKLVE